MLYITYTENGSKKKAKIDEARYNLMKSNSNISDLILYPTELIMENNYRNIICEDGSCTNKQILKD